MKYQILRKISSKNAIIGIVDRGYVGLPFSDMDCVLIATDHDAFDYDLILKNSRLIVDAQGSYPKPSSNVVRA